MIVLLAAVASAGACDLEPVPGEAAAQVPPDRYPPGRHSPLTATVLAGMGAIRDASGAPGEVFAKVGDSITWDRNFLTCFKTGADSLPPALETLRARIAGTAIDGDGKTSFDRRGHAMHWGWQTATVLEADEETSLPAPLDRELEEIDPAYAVIMLGTNDTHHWALPRYERSLTAVVDRALARGVVPILSTIPPRSDYASLAALVPVMNTIVYAVAERRGVPLLDLNAALVELDDNGLDDDGVHLRASGRPPHYACDFREESLGFGAMNQRNLLTLEGLARVATMLDGDAAPDPSPPPLEGNGSDATPFEVDALPFHATGRRTGLVKMASPSACSAQPSSTRRRYLWVAPDEPSAAVLAARAFADADVDLEVSIEAVEPDGAARCDAGPSDRFEGMMAYACVPIVPGGRYLVTVASRSRDPEHATRPSEARLSLVGHDACHGA